MSRGNQVERTPNSVREQILTLKLRIESLETELAKVKNESPSSISRTSANLTEDEIDMIFAQF